MADFPVGPGPRDLLHGWWALLNVDLVMHHLPDPSWTPHRSGAESIISSPNSWNKMANPKHSFLLTPLSGVQMQNRASSIDFAGVNVGGLRLL